MDEAGLLRPWKSRAKVSPSLAGTKTGYLDNEAGHLRRA